MSNTTKSEKTNLSIRRVVSATREEAYDAWADPKSFQQWFMGSIRDWSYEQDVRVGGRFEIMMKHEGEDMPHHGEYKVLDRPNQIQFTWASKNTNNKETLVTIEFLPNGDGTEVVLTHSALPGEFVEPHIQGWTQFVEKMDVWLTK